MKLLLFIMILTISSFSATKSSGDSISNAYYVSYNLESQQRYSDAIKALSVVKKKYPNGYTVNYRLGWLSYLNGNYADARKYYEVALSQYPSSVEIRKALILLEVARKDWKSVEKEARAGRAIDYYNIDFNYWQIVALKAMNQIDTAKKVAEEISLLYPTNTNILVQLAIIYKLKGNIDKSVALVNSVLILDPNNPEALSLKKGGK